MDNDEQFYNRIKIPLWGLFSLAILAVLYFAQSIFIPISLALLGSFLLLPAVQFLRKFHVPSSLSAALIVLMLSSVVAVGINYLAQPVGLWMDRLPTEMRQLEKKLLVFKDSIENVQETTEKFSDIATTNSSQSKSAQEVVVRGPNILFMLLDSTQSFIIGLLSFLVLLYFLLAYGHSLMREAGRLWMSRGYRKVSFRIARRVQQQVSHYLLLITAINLVLGCLVAFAMWLTGMPNPILWGVSAALLNYIPYVGPFINLFIVTLVSIITFDHVAQIVLPPMVLLILNLLEGQIVQPTFVGRMFTINPAIVFIFILVWGWLWGMAGIFMAVPILVIIKIVVDMSKELRDQNPDFE